MTEESGLATLTGWLKDANSRHDSQMAHIQFLAITSHLDEDGFRSLDSTLKKLTSFMKKLKTIGSVVSPSSLLPELEKLNVSKFLEEIAANICEAKLKIADIPSLVEFCVRVASLYAPFPGVLTAELRKHVPNKKSDTIMNPSKLRVDLRLLAELVLHGVLDREGMQLLGAALSYVINTDKTEHVNVSILMPLCRVLFYDLTGVVPVTQQRLAALRDVDISRQCASSTVFTTDQKTVVVNLFRGYLDSLLEHLAATRTELRALRKSIRRQERTRGDASTDDRKKFESVKAIHDRLLQNANDLSEFIGVKLPADIAVESASEDEELAEDTKRIDEALGTGGTLSLWTDRDQQTFYERLVDVSRLVTSASGSGRPDEPDAELSFARQDIAESVNSVDMTGLDTAETCSVAGQSQADEEEEEMVADEEQPHVDESSTDRDEATSAAADDDDLSKLTEVDLFGRGPSATPKEFFAKLTVCINRSLIDSAALEFLTHFRGKAHEKRLVQHLLAPPMDRFDLLPFYARFLATIRPVLPNVTMQVTHELLRIFRDYAKRPVPPAKRGAVRHKGQGGRTDHKVHVCTYISELVKFSILPKAEALACLRTLLVDLRQYKVDMLCAMIESMGQFLYRSPETHAKMIVIMQVMRNKSTYLIKDPRQQILLDNAYFAVIPPEEQPTPVNRRPPVQEFLRTKLNSIENRLSFFRKADWADEETANFILRLFSDPCRVRFDDLDRLASLVNAVSDYQPWVGVMVVDEVLEFIRLFLEENHPSLQQRGFSSVVYLGQLFNYNVCGTSLIINVLYQLITVGLNDIRVADPSADELMLRVQRVRLTCELINIVGEFFGRGSAKTRLDAFLTYFVRFHLANVERWTRLTSAEDGEATGSDATPAVAAAAAINLPPLDDVEHAVREVLRIWRRADEFPTTLAEAEAAVIKLEMIYKTRVAEVLQGISDYHDEERRRERHLNCIAEEDEEEEEESDDNAEDNRRRIDRLSTDGGDEAAVATAEDGQPVTNFIDNYDDEEELSGEHIRVHQQQREMQPEDEDFLRNFERIMAETMQANHMPLKGPITDLDVPPLARQKFERRITFDSAAKASPPSQSNDNYNRSLLPNRNPPASVGDSAADGSHQLQMALMTRGKKGTVLKAVKIESSETMHERWRSAQAARERERREVKELTLAMNDRIVDAS